MDPHGRRFLHGLGWGAASTLVAGIVSLLARAAHLWPGERPISVMMAEDVLVRMGWDGVAAPWLYVVAGAGQLVYGALCGALLALLSEPITRPSALGLGLLRWLTTQWVIFPALGWGEFGFLHNPGLAVVSALPHLAFALSLGWAMRQEDEGREPLPILLHPRQWHLAPVARLRRRRHH
jgi:hypothetical protein